MGILSLVRHGESVAQVAGVLPLSTDVGLSHFGFVQAQGAGRTLSRFKWDAIHCAPSLRTRQTLGTMLPEFSPRPSIFIEPRLRERNWGDLSKLEQSIWSSEEGAVVERVLAGWNERPPGGESYADMLTRVHAFFEEKIWPSVNRGGRVMLVSHNGCLKVVRAYLEGLEPHSTRPEGFSVGNAEPILYEGNDTFDSRTLMRFE